MTTHLSTRHPGAVEWAARQGVRADHRLDHLDPGIVQPGDTVMGVLLVNLAAEACARDGRFYNLSLDLPSEARGRELTADELERYGTRLDAFTVEAT